MKPLLIALAIIALTLPAIAQDATCPDQWRTIADDKAVAEAHGFTYLGLRTLPFTADQAVFYVRDGIVLLSIQKDGCVAAVAHAIGPYVPGNQI